MYGVGVTKEGVKSMAQVRGNAPDNLPFKYLGLLVGGSMTRKGGWEVLIKRFNVSCQVGRLICSLLVVDLPW